MRKPPVWSLLSTRPMWPLVLCASSILLPSYAAGAENDQPRDEAAAAATSATTTAAPTSEVEQLKRMLLDQQRQIDELRKALVNRGSDANLKANPEIVAPAASADSAVPAATGLSHPSTGAVASRTPVVPAAPDPTPKPFPLPAVPPAPQTGAADATSPLQFKLGDAFFTPVGFMDMTEVSRSTNPGSGIGTNFGSIPYGNTQAGSLTESRLSIQNSRIGMRIDAPVKGFNVMGYWESDFLGQLGNPPNGGLAVTSNPYVFRLRLYWVDVTKGKFEFLAGQSWSLMTPNRKGISPLPGDLFYSQDIDVNYQLGLVWGRIPGYRFGFHFSPKAAFAVALENSEPYVGGGNGGSAIVAPTAIAGILGSQVNNGTSVISSAALAPDIIAKLAFDPTSRFHFEVAGVEIADKIANPASTPAFQTHSKVGGGGSVNLSFALTKNLRLLTNNYYSSGGGRYIFGQAPDFIIRSDGTLSLVHSASTVSGFEATTGKTQWYAYYGGVYIGQNLALDSNKALIGYGRIANDGQNKTIQEASFGTNTTLARDAKWGALNLQFQYSYLQRNPWLVTGTSPKNAHADMGFFNLRYTLPGSAPTIGH